MPSPGIDEPNIVYLNEKHEVVAEADATLASIWLPNGLHIYAVPARIIDAKNQARAAAPAGATDEPDLQVNVRIKRGRAYSTIRREHWESIYGAVVGYLDTSLPVTSYRNLAGRAIVEHYSEAFYKGYEEASGQGDTVAAEDDSWLTDIINSSIGYMADLFAKLKDIRKAGGYDADAIARARADGYATTLDSVYGHGRILGNTNIMLTFSGPDGNESCGQCQKYKGQRHRGKWWIKYDLVRRNGNENFDCGRWDKCKHNLYKDNGELWSV